MLYNYLLAKLCAKLAPWNFCTMTTISERLLELRGERKQGEFAKLLGINPNTLRSYESGRSLPNQDILERICVHFSVSPAWLLLGHGPMKIEEFPTVPLTSETVGPPEQQSAPDSKILIEKLEKELEAERLERRTLTNENRRLYQENSTLLRENGDLREKIARLEAQQGRELPPRAEAVSLRPIPVGGHAVHESVDPCCRARVTANR